MSASPTVIESEEQCVVLPVLGSVASCSSLAMTVGDEASGLLFHLIEDRLEDALIVARVGAARFS